MPPERHSLHRRERRQDHRHSHTLQVLGVVVVRVVPGRRGLSFWAVRRAPGPSAPGFGSRLYRHVEAHARSLGAVELALDTAEGAIHLRSWYERLGFRFIQFISWDQTNYRSVILSKALD
ncbi:MAG TPA: GNAT family N-acetyltransferase [Chthoniobacteraceae bacterium]|nr:GNAT family N-acetyltransferase [Chthoniobacteraceae bacterium]